MRGLSGSTMIAATACSTVMHFFVLTLVDTVPLVPKEIAARLNTIEVELSTLSVESAVPPAGIEETKAILQQKEEKATKKPEEKKKETKKEEIKKEVRKEALKDTVVLADQHKKDRQDKKKESRVDEEQRRLAAIKEIERKVTGRPAGVSSEVPGDEKNEYPAMVEQKVKNEWIIPDSLSATGLKAVVIFEIGKKGEVINLRFKQSSGSVPYDQSVMRAIRRAAPFPPPEQFLLGEEFELTFQP